MGMSFNAELVAGVRYEDLVEERLAWARHRLVAHLYNLENPT